jgi:hypothetical protein
VAKKRPTPAKKKPRPDKATARPRREGPTRAERIDAARRQRNRRVLLGRWVIVGGLAIIVIGLGGFVLTNRAREAAWIGEVEAGSCGFDRETDADAGSGRNHVASPVYRVNPPSGGNHDPQPAPAGVYDGGTVPDDGQLVHSLEHGYVIVWHRPDLPDSALADVLEVRATFERDVLVVPRASLPTPVAATAWHQRLLCDAVEPESLTTFVRETRNEGPEAVPH